MPAWKNGSGVNERPPYQRGAGEVVHVQGVNLQLQVDAVRVLRAVRDRTITAQSPV